MAGAFTAHVLAVALVMENVSITPFSEMNVKSCARIGSTESIPNKVSNNFFIGNIGVNLRIIT